MSENRTEQVDIHSIQERDSYWEVRCYQSAAVLRVSETSTLETLRQALTDGRSVKLSWDPDTGKIYSAG